MQEQDSQRVTAAAFSLAKVGLETSAAPGFNHQHWGFHHPTNSALATRKWGSKPTTTCTLQADPYDSDRFGQHELFKAQLT